MANKPTEIVENDLEEVKVVAEATDTSIKEDISSLFGEDLTEEFKEKVSTLFEAAIADRLNEEKQRLEEESQAALETHKAELTEQVDTYMNYVVEQWMKDNEVAISSSLRNEVVEGFITGMKDLFVEHYIDVPEDKIDVLEDMAESVETLEAQLNEAIAENVEMKKMINEAQAAATFDEVCEGLADTQAEKLSVLAEGIVFEDVDSYRKKLEIIKESYFADTKKTSTIMSEDIIQDLDSDDDGKSYMKSNDPNVNRYVQAISNSIKK